MSDNKKTETTRRTPRYRVQTRDQIRGGPGRHGPTLERPKNARRTIGRLLKYLGSSRYILIIVALLLGIVTAAQLFGTWYIKPVINDFILPGNLSGLPAALLILAGVYLCGVAANFGMGQLMLRVAQRTTHTLRRDMFEHMESLPLKYFDTHAHGDLMSRFTNDMDHVQMALQQSLVEITSNVVTFIGTIAMMLVLSPVLFLVTGSVVAVMVFLSRKISGISRKHFREQQAAMGQMDGFIEENVEGIKVVKAFTREPETRAEFNQLSTEYREAATRASIFAGIIMPIMGNLNQISFALTAAFGGFLAISAGLDIGSLAAFLQYSRRMGMRSTRSPAR